MPRGEQAVRSLMQSFLRMQDPLRIIRFGIEHPEGDGRGAGTEHVPAHGMPKYTTVCHNSLWMSWVYRIIYGHYMAK